MKILNCVPAEHLPIIPQELENKIILRTLCELEHNFAGFYSVVLQKIVDEMKYDNIDFNNLTKVHIIFSKDGDVSMHNDSPITYGMHMNIIIYPVETMINSNNVPLVIFAFIEELVHHFWRIDDETKVKYKTLKIIQRIEPKITLEVIKRWELNWN